MLGSGRICTNSHISGVGLRNTVVDSVYSTLCLGKVHVIWQKTGKSSPWLSQSVPSSGLQTRKPGNHASFCMKTVFFRQSDEPDCLLVSFFSLPSWLETTGLSRNCARCVRQGGEGSSVIGGGTWNWDCNWDRGRQRPESGSVSEWVCLYAGGGVRELQDLSLERDNCRLRLSILHSQEILAVREGGSSIYLANISEYLLCSRDWLSGW